MDYRKVRFTALTLAVNASTGMIPGTHELVHAQTNNNCYLDDRGRIVTRRRPGYQRVECPPINQNPDTPATTTPTQQPATTPSAQPTLRYEPVEEGATDVFFTETKPGSTPQTQPNSNDSQPVQSPSATGLFQLPSGRNNEPVVTSDGSTTTVEELRAPDNPISLIPRPKLEDYQPSIPVPDRFIIVNDLGTLTTGKPDGFCRVTA